MGYVESGPAVTVYRTVYSHDRYFEGDRGEPVAESVDVFHVDNWCCDYGEWVDGPDSEVWRDASRAVVAFHMLNGEHTQFWQVAASTSGAEVSAGDNPWYVAEIEERFDGTYVEASAHLSGFEAGEVAEVYALCRR